MSGKREEEDAHLPDWRLRLVPEITSCSHTQDRQSVQRQTQLKAMRGMLGVQSMPIRHMTRHTSADHLVVLLQCHNDDRNVDSENKQLHT